MFKIIGADQKEYGPSSTEEIRAWIKEGRADGRTLARAEGTTEWRPLSAFPEFAGITIQSSAPPPLSGAARIPAYPGAIPGMTDLAGEPDFDMGECLGNGFRLLMGNFVLLVGASTLAWFLVFGISLLTSMAGLSFITVLFSGVIYGGLYSVFLARIRNQPIGLGATFAGFGASFVHLLLAGFLTQLLTFVGFCLCIIPGIYLIFAWIFAVAIVADQHAEFWSAMELSRKRVTRHWFKVVGLVVVAFIPLIICKAIEAVQYVDLALPIFREAMASAQSGSPPNVEHWRPQFEAIMIKLAPFTLAGQIVLLVNLPFATGALMYAYESLFGSRSTRST